MRFIFSVVTNSTYTLFCASIQYVILFVYRLLFSLALYLFSLSLVVFTLYSTVFLCALCIALLVAYDADTFRSQHDILVECNNIGGRDNGNLAESAGAVSSHAEAHNDVDAPNGTGTVVGMPVLRDSHVDALLTLLLCHASMMCVVFVLFVVFLYECINVDKSVICRMAFGDHAANHTIGIAMLILTFSILLPLLGLYKRNVGKSRVFRTHLPSFVILFTSLSHIGIVSKMQFYSRTCPLLVSFSGSLYVVYCSIALHFLFRIANVAVGFCIRQIQQRQHRHKHHTPPHSDPNPTATQDNMYSTVFVLIANTVLLLANLAYAWRISMVFNGIQTVVILLFVLCMSHRIIKMPTIRYSKKRQ